MDVRLIEDVASEIEHSGTVPVWWLVRPRELFAVGQPDAGPVDYTTHPVRRQDEFEK